MSSTTRHLTRKLAAVGATCLAIFAGAAALPSAGPGGTSSPVIAAIAPGEAAAASPMACANLARNTFYATRNPWYAMKAVRSVRGCGDFNADVICWTSRQRLGGGARAIVRAVTGGQYDRC